MKKLALIIMTLCLSNVALADENASTVYESSQPGGVSDFSDQPDSDVPETTFQLDPLQDPSAGNPDVSTQAQTQTTQQPSPDSADNLNQQDQQMATLKQKVDEAQAILSSTQDSLNQARAAQDAGKTTIGNDQYIDEFYIQHLEQNVAVAQANYQAALEEYNNFVAQIGD